MGNASTDDREPATAGRAQLAISNFPADLHRRLRMAAARDGVSLRALLEDCVRFRLGAHSRRAFFVPPGTPAERLRKEDPTLVIHLIENGQEGRAGIAAWCEGGRERAIGYQEFMRERIGQTYERGEPVRITFDRGRSYWRLVGVEESEAGPLVRLKPEEDPREMKERLLARSRAAMGGHPAPSMDDVVGTVRADRDRG